MIEQTVSSCVFASFVLPAAPPAPPAPEAPPCSAPEQVSWLALLAEPVPVPAAGGCGLAASSLSSSLFGVIPPCTPDLQQFFLHDIFYLILVLLDYVIEL
jgi:hypothetical protein